MVRRSFVRGLSRYSGYNLAYQITQIQRYTTDVNDNYKFDEMLSEYNKFYIGYVD